MWNWLRKLLKQFKKKRPSTVQWTEALKRPIIVHKEPVQLPENSPNCAYFPTTPNPRSHEYTTQMKSGLAVHRDISQFIEHGKQSKHYRKTVKQHKQPTEDD